MTMNTETSHRLTTVVVLAAFTLWEQDPETLGLRPTCVTVEHLVDFEGGNVFGVKRDGAFVTMSPTDWSNAEFATAPEAMTFALDLCGWLHAVTPEGGR